MRIPNLTISHALVARLNTLNTQQNQYNDQLASGQRITSPSEDPQAASRILRLRSEKSEIQVYAKNGDRALSVSQASFAALDQLKNLSDRASELAALSNSGNVSAAERKSYAIELNEIIKEAIDAGNTTYQGEFLFNGTFTKLPPPLQPFTAADIDTPAALATTPAAADGLSIQLSGSVSISPFTTGAGNAKIATFITNMIALRKGLDNTAAATDAGTAAITSARSALLRSEDDLIGIIADNSALQTRMESVKAQSEARVNNIQSLISKDADVDVSQTMVNLTRVRTAYQAALQSGAQVMKLSLLDYLP